MGTPEPRQSRAGIAFIDAVTGDPAAEAAIERARTKLRRFAIATEPVRACRAIIDAALASLMSELMQSDSASVAERAEAIRLMVDVVQGAFDDSDDALHARGFTPPGHSIEAWEHLARIVEREPSQMTFAEIFEWAIAWSDREKLRARISSSNDKIVKAGGPKLQKEALAVALLVQHPDWTNSKIADAVGCARTSLNRWPRFKLARAALQSGRPNLPRGQKDDETGDIEAWDDE